MPITRSQFLRRIVPAGLALTTGGFLYGLVEAGWIETCEVTVALPRLPSAFEGKRVALLTDLHHGPFTGLNYLQKVVERTNALKPDLICLTGDFVHRGSQYFEPCAEVLKQLQAPLGVFAVLGNHDHWHGASNCRRALARNGIEDLSNAGIWLQSQGQRLRLAGVDDFWMANTDLATAMGDTHDDDCCVLLSHNPDFAETLEDPRVTLVLSGHTHGGQIRFPWFGAPVVPSLYGQKYLAGLVQAPHTLVYVSRGLGTITPPLRYRCAPELTVITLAAQDHGNQENSGPKGAI